MSTQEVPPVRARTLRERLSATGTALMTGFVGLMATGGVQAAVDLTETTSTIEQIVPLMLLLSLFAGLSRSFKSAF